MIDYEVFQQRRSGNFFVFRILSLSFFLLYFSPSTIFRSNFSAGNLVNRENIFFSFLSSLFHFLHSTQKKSKIILYSFSFLDFDLVFLHSIVKFSRYPYFSIWKINLFFYSILSGGYIFRFHCAVVRVNRALNSLSSKK